MSFDKFLEEKVTSSSSEKCKQVLSSSIIDYFETFTAPLPLPSRLDSSDCPAGYVSIFLENILEHPTDRSFLLDREEEMIDLINSERKNKGTKLVYRNLNSYQRLIVHRCAGYFGLGHTSSPKTQEMLVFYKNESVIPKTLLKDIPVTVSPNMLAVSDASAPKSTAAGIDEQISSPRLENVIVKCFSESNRSPTPKQSFYKKGAAYFRHPASSAHATRGASMFAHQQPDLNFIAVPPMAPQTAIYYPFNRIHHPMLLSQYLTTFSSPECAGTYHVNQPYFVMLNPSMKDASVGMPIHQAPAISASGSKANYVSGDEYNPYRERRPSHQATSQPCKSPKPEQPLPLSQNVFDSESTLNEDSESTFN